MKLAVGTQERITARHSQAGRRSVMPVHGDVHDFGPVVIGAGPAGTTAAELDSVLAYSAALVEQDIAGSTEVSWGGGPAQPFLETAAYLSPSGKEEICEIALSAPPEVMYPAVRVRDREFGEQLRRATLERIGERGLRLIHGERWLVSSRSGGTCSSLAWFSSGWRSRSIRFR
jgi:pyruvate/2-oxoglutarate dehydrogenase complex dihydrolipoamide dehydrogenase (E3) component